MGTLDIPQARHWGRLGRWAHRCQASGGDVLHDELAPAPVVLAELEAQLGGGAPLLDPTSHHITSRITLGGAEPSNLFFDFG